MGKQNDFQKLDYKFENKFFSDLNPAMPLSKWP